MSETFDGVLQVLAVLVPIVALVQARRTPGRRYADRAKMSLELVAALEANGAVADSASLAAPAGRGSVAGLRDDARFNAARYLNAGSPLGLRAPLIGMASFYTVAFLWMGVNDIAGGSSRTETLTGTLFIGLAGASLLVAVVALRQRYVEHAARRGAGLPVVTTVSELRDVARTIRNRIAIARHRRAAHRPGNQPLPSKRSTILQASSERAYGLTSAAPHSPHERGN